MFGDGVGHSLPFSDRRQCFSQDALQSKKVWRGFDQDGIPAIFNKHDRMRLDPQLSP